MLAPARTASSGPAAPRAPCSPANATIDTPRAPKTAPRATKAVTTTRTPGTPIAERRRRSARLPLSSAGPAVAARSAGGRARDRKAGRHRAGDAVRARAGLDQQYSPEPHHGHWQPTDEAGGDETARALDREQLRIGVAHARPFRPSSVRPSSVWSCRRVAGSPDGSPAASLTGWKVRAPACSSSVTAPAGTKPT